MRNLSSAVFAKLVTQILKMGGVDTRAIKVTKVIHEGREKTAILIDEKFIEEEAERKKKADKK